MYIHEYELAHPSVTVYCDVRMTLQARTLQTKSKRPAAQELIDRLNSGDTSAASKRIERILELLVEAESLRTSMYERLGEKVWTLEEKTRRYPEGFLARREFQDDRLQALQADYEKCLGELYKKLSRYRWRFVVWDSDYHWLHKMTVPDVRGKGDMWEHDSVIWLLSELQGETSRAFYSGVPSGLARYRRCSNCSRWFYAQTEHQRFCEEICRKANASKSEVFKEKRRLYMRKRRADEKAEDMRSLARVRRGLRKP
jgi:hypothetical protein